MSDLLDRLKKRQLPGLTRIKQPVQIDILRPTDHKGFTVKVDKETAVGYQTKAYEQDKYMIWKNGPGWSFPKHDKYLAIEGELLTSFVTEESEVELLSVPDFIRKVWTGVKLKDSEGAEGLGELFYDRLPAELKKPLEHNKWAATVTVHPGTIDDDAEAVLGVVKAQEILKDASLEIANDAARAKEKKDKLAVLVNQIYLIGFGFFLSYFVSNALELF